MLDEHRLQSAVNFISHQLPQLPLLVMQAQGAEPVTEKVSQSFFGTGCWNLSAIGGAKSQKAQSKSSHALATSIIDFNPKIVSDSEQVRPQVPIKVHSTTPSSTAVVAAYQPVARSSHSKSQEMGLESSSHCLLFLESLWSRFWMNGPPSPSSGEVTQVLSVPQVPKAEVPLLQVLTEEVAPMLWVVAIAVVSISMPSTVDL